MPPGSRGAGSVRTEAMPSGVSSVPRSSSTTATLAPRRTELSGYLRNHISTMFLFPGEIQKPFYLDNGKNG